MIVPIAYFISLVVLFSLDMSDDYMRDGLVAGSEMQEGFLNISLNAGGGVRIAVVFVLLGVGCFAALAFRVISARRKMDKINKEKAASMASRASRSRS